jgi:Flp pilus assembly protein TadG
MNKMLRRWRDQKGVTIVLVAGLTVMLLAFAALSVDIAHLYAVQKELQNAADAGALAGGRRLYYHDGSAVNTDSNQIACEAATENNSERIAVEVNSPDTNADDVQRGHWSFTTRTFTRSDRTTVPDLWEATTEQLDNDTTFVNAIKVTTRRESTQANSFFARILGFTGFAVTAEAIAYIGYAGEISSMTVDQPIVICKQSITNNNGEYSCATARMMNATIDTAAWTNFSQPCDTADAASVSPLVCQEPGANPTSVVIGRFMGTNNGQIQSAYADFISCWQNNSSLDTDGDGVPDQVWSLVLPVVNCCPDGNPNCDPEIGNCSRFVGIVNAEILWVSGSGGGHIVWPREMGDWTCPAGLTDEECWDSFALYYNIKNYDGSYPSQEQKSVYFRASCAPHLPVGVTGGQNFGVLAKIPVLVD